MENNFSILIPARIGSTRLLNKPLIDLYGKSLIQRVYEQARTISDDVYIASTFFPDSKLYTTLCSAP